MTWGAWGKQLTIQQQSEMIEFCVAQGNTTFDHADIYGDYASEAHFGEAFAKSTVQREAIQLISKCGIQLEGGIRNNRLKHYNYSKEYIIWSAEESLRKLKTDYLDTFLLHRPSPLMQPDEIAEAISKLQVEGKIKAFGVSNFTPSQVDLIATETPISVNQIEFSLTQHTAMENGTLDQMLQHKIQPLAWSPLGSIFRESNDKTTQIKRLLGDLAEKYNTTEDVILLSWILKHPAQISPVIGTTNRQRILNSNTALSIHLELEEWFQLLELSKGEPVA